MAIANDIPSALLSHLQTTLAAPDLSYAEPPAQITGGYETTIYSLRLSGAPDEWARPLILRLFRADTRTDQPRFERAVHNAVASLGYPAPRVFLAHDQFEPLGGAFVIMERVQGRLMFEMIMRPRRKWNLLPRVMAEMHARLHTLDAETFAAALERDGVSRQRASVSVDVELAEREIERHSLDGLRPGLRWLVDNRPPQPEQLSICHGDFHPLNILMEHRNVTGVIDWSWMTLGDPAYDVGATVAIFSSGPVDLPGFLRPLINFFRRWFAGAYLSAYQKERPLDLAAVRYYEALRCLGFLIEGSEHILAESGRIERPFKPTAFGAAHVVRSIVRRFHEISGVNVTLPESHP